MKNTPWILLIGGLTTLAFLPGACGGSGGGTGGTGGSGTSSSSTTTTVSSTTSSVSTGTGTPMCSDLVDTSNDCGACEAQKCCNEILDCSNDTTCSDCSMGNGDATTCDANAAFVAFAMCVQTNCDVCIPKSECNPVTNEGCTNAGAACDFSQSGVFVCFDGPGNDTAICGACSNANGPYCAPGSHCNEDASGGQCTRYCCTDADCGTGKCDMDTFGFPNGIGACVGMDDAGTTLASCDAPSVPPSGGSCYMQ